MIAKGIIEQVNEKQVQTKKGLKDSYGVKINGEWYNAWGQAPCNEGDNASIEYEINGEYKNITKLTLVEDKKSSGNDAPNARMPNNVKSSEIAKSVALKAALHLAEINMKSGKEYEAIQPKQIITLAREFEKYLTEKVSL